MDFAANNKLSLNNNELVSIIITCYNCEKYIAECLDSVLASTYKKYEIIVVNDGSPENEQNILKKYINKYPQIKIINQNNSGVCIARNNGIAAASGKYILCLDGDDKISPYYIEEAMKAFQKDSSLGIVYCEVAFFGKRKGKWDLPPYKFPDILSNNLIFSSAFFKKEDFLIVGGYKRQMSLGLEDWEFWVSMIEHGCKVYRIPKLLFFYRQRDNSRSCTANIRCNNLAMRKQIIRLHTKMYIRNKMFLDEVMSNILNYKLLRCALFNFIPVYARNQLFGKTVYSVFGLPVWKIRKMENGFTTKYYFLNIPLLKVTKK